MNWDIMHRVFANTNRWLRIALRSERLSCCRCRIRFHCSISSSFSWKYAMRISSSCSSFDSTSFSSCIESQTVKKEEPSALYPHTTHFRATTKPALPCACSTCVCALSSASLLWLLPPRRPLLHPSPRIPPHSVVGASRRCQAHHGYAHGCWWRYRRHHQKSISECSLHLSWFRYVADRLGADAVDHNHQRVHHEYNDSHWKKHPWQNGSPDLRYSRHSRRLVWREAVGVRLQRHPQS